MDRFLKVSRLQLKFSKSLNTPFLIAYQIKEFFKSMHLTTQYYGYPSVDLKELYCSIEKSELSHTKVHYSFMNRSDQERVFLLHLNLVKSLHIENLVENENKHVELFNEKYVIFTLNARSSVNSNDFNLIYYNFPPMINIKSNLISRHPSNNHFSSILHSSALPFKYNKHYFYFNQNKVKFFKIKSSDLNRIHVEFKRRTTGLNKLK